MVIIVGSRLFVDASSYIKARRLTPILALPPRIGSASARELRVCLCARTATPAGCLGATDLGLALFLTVPFANDSDSAT